MKDVFDAYSDMKKRHKSEVIDSRMKYAIDAIESCNLTVDSTDDNCIFFTYKGSIIRFYPYTGWASGKTIDDSRGINNLIKQIGV